MISFKCLLQGGLPIVGSESYIDPHDRDGIYFSIMVELVQICQLVIN
jgi:hypothetical protein